MKKINKGLKNKENGITLIALVITIIVLLILAGVSISMLTGQNGVLSQTTEAKKQTKEASQNEKYDLAKTEDIINESQTNIVVEQVSDANPGTLEGEGTEESPYVINSIEDLVYFAYDVRNGNNYDGKNVKLGLSLDFNSTKSYMEPFSTAYAEYGYDGELKTLLTSGEGFMPIGLLYDSDTQNFYGTFDGNGNTIYNLYINKIATDDSGLKMGFFTNNKGKILNLKLLNVNLYLKSNNGALGGISGQNSKTGSIKNCIVSGKIENDSVGGKIGGITGYCSGNIEKCGNIANIIGNMQTSDKTVYIGGICSNSGINAKINSCYNIGNITGKNPEGYMYLGGITGHNDSNTEIQNCYNGGKIVGNAQVTRVGGIIGNQSGAVENCYDIGNVEGTATKEVTVGMCIGRMYNTNVSINYIYYLKNENGITGLGIGEDLEGMAKSEKEMKESSFLDLLNKTSNSWKSDDNNINNGYPILSWQ